MLRAGPMDRRIQLQRSVPVRSATNTPTDTWQPIATVWAQKEDLSDRERLVAMEIGADVTTRFRIHWSSVVADINPKDRIFFQGRVWNIAAVREIDRRAGLEIYASARTD